MNIGFVRLPVKRLRKNIQPLRRSTSCAAGTDVAYAGNEPVTIYPEQVVKLPTGYAFQVPDNIAMQILPRSGLSTKQQLRPANTPGLLDPDYRGELFIVVENFGPERRTIQPGEYIAQIMFTPFYKPIWDYQDELDKTERGDQGFGSTEHRGYLD